MERFISDANRDAYDDYMKALDPNYFDNSKVTNWKDFYLWQDFPIENVKFACENWEPNEDDVLIVAFAKTGFDYSYYI